MLPLLILSTQQPQDQHCHSYCDSENGRKEPEASLPEKGIPPLPCLLGGREHILNCAPRQDLVELPVPLKEMVPGCLFWLRSASPLGVFAGLSLVLVEHTEPLCHSLHPGYPVVLHRGLRSGWRKGLHGLEGKPSQEGCLVGMSPGCGLACAL
jgi:hypothetical protein